jgi:hypothetical protein
MWPELSQVVDPIGFYPFRAAVRSESGGDVAVIQLADATRSAGEIGDVPWLVNRDGKFDRYLLKPGDVLIQARGFRNPAGTVSIDLPVIAAPGLHTLRPRAGKILPEYLAWCLNHPRIQSAIAKVARGSHAPFISKQALAQIRVPVPPMIAQQRIVEVDRLHQNEREIAARLAEAQHQLVNESTWRAATATS